MLIQRLWCSSGICCRMVWKTEDISALQQTSAMTCHSNTSLVCYDALKTYLVEEFSVDASSLLLMVDTDTDAGDKEPFDKWRTVILSVNCSYGCVNWLAIIAVHFIVWVGTYCSSQVDWTLWQHNLLSLSCFLCYISTFQETLMAWTEPC